MLPVAGKPRKIDLPVARQMLASGSRISDVAERFHVTWTAVRELLRYHDEPGYRERKNEQTKRSRALRPDDPPPPRPCNRCGINMHPRRRKWCPDCAVLVRDEQIYNARRRNTGAVRINKCLDCSKPGHTSPRCPDRFKTREDT